MGITPLYDTDRYTAMDRWHTVQCAAHLELLDDVARMDQAEDWTFDGASSMGHWLVNRYGLTHRTANEWVRVAGAIQDLPALRAAYRAGRISWDQLRAVTRLATPETDDELAAEAPSLSMRELNRRARELTLRDVQKVHRDRSFTWEFDETNPVLRFNGQMVDADGVEFVKTITRLASQMPPQPGGTHEPFEARCLDAVLMLASQQRGADSDPDRVSAVIHVPVAALTEDEGSAEFEEGTRLLPETLHRLLCDARLQIQADGVDGSAVGVGRTTRTIPPWLARIVRKRDPGCRYPGCGRSRWIHIHHLIHWAHGGPTNLDNLISLCLYHHRLVHEDGWRISGDPNGEVVWIRPGGEPFIPGWRDEQANNGVTILDDFSIPPRLRGPEIDDTS
ncbi:MAG: DUF222 domain-containing protein [Acidimicrobiia bacterium]|nr:DUF222 domain-containing protein [Acidimicrobiia bacterium]